MKEFGAVYCDARSQYASGMFAGMGLNGVGHPSRADLLWIEVSAESESGQGLSPGTLPSRVGPRHWGQAPVSSVATTGTVMSQEMIMSQDARRILEWVNIGKEGVRRRVSA